MTMQSELMNSLCGLTPFNYFKTEKMKISIIAIFLLPFSWLMGQGLSCEEFLKQVESANLQLSAIRAETDAQKLSHRLDMGFEDPEIEATFFSGTPSDMGSRQVVSVSQWFNLPMIYTSRKKLADAKAQNNEYEFQQTRQEILLMAEQLFVEYVYQQKVAEVSKLRSDEARNLMESYSAKYDKGNASVLDLNKAKIQYSLQQNNFAIAQSNLKVLEKQLEYLSGGSFEQQKCSYRLLDLPDIDSLKADFEQYSPDLMYWQLKQKQADLQVKLNRGQNLPKLMLGYEGEFEGDGSFNGIKAGISIPLWSNCKSVKYAKMQQLSAQASQEFIRKDKLSEIERLHDDLQALSIASNLYKKTVEETTSTELLNKALGMGQISVIEYFNELQNYYEIEDRYYETEKALYLKYALLMKFQL